MRGWAGKGCSVGIEPASMAAGLVLAELEELVQSERGHGEVRPAGQRWRLRPQMVRTVQAREPGQPHRDTRRHLGACHSARVLRYSYSPQFRQGLFSYKN